MTYREMSNDFVPSVGSGQGETAHDSESALGRYSLRPCTPPARSASVTMALCVGLVALSLNGCRHHDNVPLEPTVAEPPPMDTLLVSDLVRYYLDGDMEVDRGIADCYGGQCVQTDGERVVFNLPEWYAFPGHHDDVISAREDTLEERNGIMIGDVSFGEKELPDYPGVAIDRTVTGYGGWGEHFGFDALYYDFVRYDEDEDRDRPQRMVEASLGGWASEGNPPVPRDETWTWTGAAVGVDHSDITQDRVLVGNSALSVYLYEALDDYLVSVDITDLVDVATGTPYDDMTWSGIPLRDGGFETFEIQGQFFGPNHEEVGGVFERDQVIGAFGGTRGEEPDSE